MDYLKINQLGYRLGYRFIKNKANLTKTPFKEMLKKTRDLNKLVDQFDELPFIIGVGKLSMVGVSDYSKRDYFIVRIKPKRREISNKLGNCEVLEFSHIAKKQFLQNISMYEIVLDNELGKVYELKGRLGYFRTKVKLNDQML